MVDEKDILYGLKEKKIGFQRMRNNIMVSFDKCSDIK